MAKYKLLLPKMGESVAEATIIKWNKNVGDLVEIDDTVIDIATDKVDSEVPSPVKGRLVLQLCKENEVIQVGGVLGIIETDEPEAPLTAEQDTAIKNFKLPDTDNNNAPKAEVVSETPAASHEEEFFPELTEDKHDEEILPEESTEAVPGISQLDTTAKAVVPSSGARFYSPLVKNIAVQEGITPQEMDAIPGTGSEGRLTKDDILLYVRKRGTGAVASPLSTPAPAPQQTLRPSEMLEQPKFIKTEAPVIPTVIPQAEAPKVETPVVEQTRPQAVPEKSATAAVAQSVPQKSVAASAIQSAPSRSTSGADEIIEMDRMRKLIADHMVASVHTSPHVTSFVEADVTNMVLWRDKVKAGFEKREGTKITFTPIFIEAVAKAIKDFPMINVSVNGTQIIKKKNINIGMAAALPSGNLIVPVIRNADELNLVGLSKAVNDLANRSRTSKLQPDEIKEGTFTITNIGSFGNAMGTPIINQPQVAILAVGVIKKKPAVIETPTGDVIAIRHMMFLSLSYDHRVVDGALGGSFIRRVADYLENWDLDREV
ncbi:2-oxo acid dehydrogenase subunit E2 [Mucilaginibacter sp. HMF5004]|uniref:dihydrolipoamide acetyltransferase family protein n=1 Tax=Mucilaginibacter rivuli TaxID=2857527 RepID=UPI001C5F53D9|nr:dihydrolipoamide acetyltransferase family protein [Mucilaginibacter rivuli]MBW4889580.1 2-oxo acid dehydrogenase subunit E2 [Mucilaginibacter rivuli]